MLIGETFTRHLLYVITPVCGTTPNQRCQNLCGLEVDGFALVFRIDRFHEGALFLRDDNDREVIYQDVAKLPTRNLLDELSPLRQFWLAP